MRLEWSWAESCLSITEGTSGRLLGPTQTHRMRMFGVGPRTLHSSGSTGDGTHSWLHLSWRKVKLTEASGLGSTASGGQESGVLLENEVTCFRPRTFYQEILREHQFIISVCGPSSPRECQPQEGKILVSSVQ